MPEKSQKKTEVRVFLEGVQLKLVDDLIGIYGNTRSEVIRNIIQIWFNDNIEKRKEILELGKEAQKEGYTSLPEK
ncbi:hypothetical protein AKJ39_03120 [candidate division MSBL1 archaeon SCGC-AAA259J03]|uniref:CopG family transcriptional regulator n=2 Tax=candidate division MSBL1 TaxID=215777 RepID=A0A656YWG8_9EURY|nr:hypothetical protein AKJ36_02570 [candidate division MSBL1 archaeon SCGC-AAA259I07]KXA97639.1 hypothetical protein AKJ39_03120 [candidate division MSBL1 archaeon SCGC-AAA259J03]